MNKNVIVNNLSRNWFHMNSGNVKWGDFLSCTICQIFTRFYFTTLVLSFETSDTDYSNVVMSFTHFSEFE